MVNHQESVFAPSERRNQNSTDYPVQENMFRRRFGHHLSPLPRRRVSRSIAIGKLLFLSAGSLCHRPAFCDRLSSERAQPGLAVPLLRPSPRFSVTLQLKELAVCVSGLESAVAGIFANVAAKGLAALDCTTIVQRGSLL
jgi:hypothetical protein